MGQVSSKLRRGPAQFFHWCPGCEEMHPLPDSWQFDGNLERPTFSPSFKQGGAGVGNMKADVCHYFIRDGQIEFCGDSWHSLKGKTVPLPDLPPELRDE